MNNKLTLRSVIFVAIFLTSTLLATSLAGQLLGGSNSLLPNVPRAHAQIEPILGIDCGLGSTTAASTPTPTTSYTTDAATYNFGPANIPAAGAGSLSTSCSFGGDADLPFNGGIPDGTPEPLVMDQPGSTAFACTAGTPSGCVSTNYGGGFNAEVRVTGLDPACNNHVNSVGCPNGFDITVSYNPKVLNAVSFDQYGLEFCPSGNPSSTVSGCGEPLGSGGIILTAASIDNSVGQARLSEALLAVTTFPDTAGNQGVTLFRIRFDVVGVGSSTISPSGQIVNPGAIAHTEQPATFEDTTFFDPTALGWNASFSFAPNPPTPGSSMTFTPTAICPGCTAPLSYAWDFSSHGVTDSTANTPTITPPPPAVNRVTLTITDGLANSITLVRLVPFSVALVGPASVAVGAAANYNGLWLGGTPTYSGSMRLCPGGLAPPQTLVCTIPSPGIAATPTQTAPVSNTYKFGGVFTNKLTIATTASGGLAGTSVTATQTTNVTGTPLAFTVSANANPTSITPGQSVSFTATAAYAAAYPSYAASADTLVNGTAPALGSTLAQDSTHIRFVEQAGCIGCLINGLWDPVEWIFFCPATCATLPGTAGQPTDAIVLYHGTVAKPLTGALTKTDGHLKFVGGAAFATGNPVIYDDSSTAGGSYSASLSYTFKFGDGTQTTVSSGLTSTSTGGFTATTSHTYTGSGTFQPAVLVQETGTAAGTLGPLSAIQEAGFTAPVAVGVAGVTVTVNCGAATVGKPVTCSASATGGTGTGFTFSWSAPGGSPASGTGPSFTVTYSAKGTPTITATATDSASNTGSKQTTVTVTGQPIVTDFTFSPASPQSGQQVTFTATASGGTGPYTFSWNFGDGSPAGTGSPATHIYTAAGNFPAVLTTTDMNGVTQTASHSVTVVPPTPITVTVTCGAATTGKPVNCSATAQGGSGTGFTFSWSAPGGSPATGTGASFTVTYATKGSKTITTTATDSASATGSKDTIVTVAGQPIVVTVTCGSATAAKPVTCNASATGGTAPYSFTWSSNGSPAIGSGASYTTTFAAKGSQTVTATATDGNSVTKTGTATVAVAAQPIVVTVTCGTATAGKPVTCNASATGGTTPYSFTWSSNGSPATGTGASYTTTFAAKGSQTVTATATDGNSVTMSGTASVTVAAQPIATDFTFSPTSPTSGQDVTFTASASGGTSPYTFSWNFGDGSAAVSGSPAHHIFTVTVQTTFTVVLTTTDLNNVPKTASHTITVAPAGPGLAISVSCGTATTGKPVTCTATVTGGQTPYGTVSWSAPGGSPATGSGNSFTTTYAAKATNVVTASVTDAASANAQGSANVVVAGQPIVVTVTCGTATAGKPVTCNASATGGTGPYTFAWSSNGSPATGTGASYTTTFAAKGSQTVTATATDGNSVTMSGTASVTVAAQPIATDFTFTPTSPTSGQDVTFTAATSGGTSPYSFSWDFGDSSPAGSGNPAHHIYTVTSTTNFNVVLTVTDQNAIPQTASHTVTVGPPAGFTVTVTCGSATVGKPVTCNATPNGGTGPFTFSWSAPGGSPATGTSAGFTTTYSTKGTNTVSVTATDSGGATGPGSASVTVAGQALTVTATCPTSGLTAGKPFTCTVSASGGTAPYTGTGSISRTEQAKGTFTETFSVTDANSITASGTATVTVAAQPFTADFTFLPTTPSSGQSVTFTASGTGGSSPYSFSWDFGDSSAPGSGSPVQHAYTVTSTTTFHVVLTATDANSATATATHDVTVTPGVSGITVTVSCGSATAGKPVTCDASATGGTGTFTFSWSAPGGSPSTGSGASFTTTYSVKGTNSVTATATDSSGATGQGSASVLVSAQSLTTTFAVSPSSPPVGSPATFTATVTGGTAPYSFSWNFGDSFTGTGNPVQHTYSTAGRFNVTLTVTDANQVSTTASVTVTTTTAGQFTVDFAPKLTIVGNTAFVPLITGGSSPFSCTWNFGDGSALATACLATHFYTNPGKFNVTLTATDSSGATASTFGPVRVQNAPRISGQQVQKRILPGQTENITITIRNFSSLSVDIALSVQIFDITGHTNSLVTTLSDTFTVGPSSSMAVVVQWTPPSVVADYRDVAMISYSHSFGDLNGDGTSESVAGTSPFQSRRGFSVVMPSIIGQSVQEHIARGETENFLILVRNPTPYTANIVLTIQIFNITGHTNTLVTTLTQSVTLDPMSTTRVSLSYTPAPIVADYRDVAQISGTSFQSRRGFSVV